MGGCGGDTVDSMATDSHLGYSDESSWNSQFGSIALINGTSAAINELEHVIEKRLRQNNSEFKWTKVNSQDSISVASSLIDKTFSAIGSGRVRVDVIIRNNQDKRHKLPGRDDVKVLEYMYGQLVANVIRMRWSGEGRWTIYADEDSRMKWPTLENKVNGRLWWAEHNLDSQRPMSYINTVDDKFLERITPKESDRTPLIQLADLFAGLAAFSYNNYSEIVGWIGHSRLQGQLASFSDKLSDGRRAKLDVLNYLLDGGRARRLGIDLTKNQGLVTRNPSQPINFWLYRPQHPADKATRRRE